MTDTAQLLVAVGGGWWNNQEASGLDVDMPR